MSAHNVGSGWVSEFFTFFPKLRTREYSGRQCHSKDCKFSINCKNESHYHCNLCNFVVKGLREQTKECHLKSKHSADCRFKSVFSALNLADNVVSQIDNIDSQFNILSEHEYFTKPHQPSDNFQTEVNEENILT